MRQRASAAATPPRSADSDHAQWAKQQLQPPQARRSYSKEDVAVAVDHSMEGGQHQLHARRRRTAGGAGATKHPTAEQQPQPQLRHSPQHYMAEYNKNFGNVSDAAAATTGEKPPPNSAGMRAALPYQRSYSSHVEQENRYQQTASDVYYAQYGSHHQPKEKSSQYSASADSANANNYHDNSATPALHRVRSTPNAHQSSFQHFQKSFHLDPNPLAAVHFRKALHVPDKHYQEFLLGKRGQKDASIFSKICCANTCAGFSLVGFIFMLFIGILLDTQPLFIGGTLPSALKETDGGKTTVIHFVTAERLPSASHAYQSAFAYIVTTVACLIFVYYERLNSMGKRRNYQDVPDLFTSASASVAASSPTNAMIGDGDELPHHHHHHHEDAPAYHLPNYSVWNRVMTTTSIKVREWSVTAGQRLWNGRATPGRNRNKNRKKAFAKTI